MCFVTDITVVGFKHIATWKGLHKVLSFIIISLSTGKKVVCVVLYRKFNHLLIMPARINHY